MSSQPLRITVGVISQLVGSGLTATDIKAPHSPF